jgi:hypothetical protein
MAALAKRIDMAEHKESGQNVISQIALDQVTHFLWETDEYPL